MKIFYESILFKLPMLKEFEAIVIGRLCFLKKPKNDSIEQKSIIVHELVHQKQMDRLGVIYFYFLYLLEYSINYLKYRDSLEAYLKISFEIEAYEVQEKFLNGKI